MGPQRRLSEVGEVKPNGDAGNKEPAASPKTVDCSSLTALFGVGIHGFTRLSEYQEDRTSLKSGFEQVPKNQVRLFEDSIWIGSPDHADLRGEMGV